ncbi:hypothetical protein [Burkholderia cepacia]|uniref:hypothetical protein n=1 Tax=Burkholderia cepacia TaxID=292 RepID=UPI001F2BCA73|nr:hypothetical protein [Burkholderia cepacia]UIY58158.1 hypothetical protein LZ568_08065 [Burkholderia cepacia]
MLRKMWSGTEVQQWIDDNIKPLVQERHHDYHCGSNATPSPADERASWADEIIGDLQESFDTEGITENDSGDALIRLSSAIAAVEEAAQARAASANETGAEGVAELESMTRMFHAACHDLGLINEALGLDPDDGGAEPILDAIAELRAQIASAQTDEPVAWAVYNGWSRICFYMTEEDARDHAQKAQKNHDLSGSLAAFRVVPLYAAPQPARAATPDAEAVNWRELSRRLYVELFHCDQQMRSTRDEDGEPHWTQSAVVRDVLADAKAALDGAPQPAQADARVGLTATQLATIRLGLTAAKHFIANGIELGFIRMPDANCPDPAHDTPKLVDEALALLQGANQS